MTLVGKALGRKYRLRLGDVGTRGRGSYKLISGDPTISGTPVVQTGVNKTEFSPWRPRRLRCCEGFWTLLDFISQIKVLSMPSCN